MKRLILALVAGVGLAFAFGGWGSSAQALTPAGVKRPDDAGGVIKVRRGGGRGGFRGGGGGGRAFRGGGGGGRAFRGGGFRGGGRAFRGGGRVFRGGGVRRFRGGRVYRGRRGFRRFRGGGVYFYGGPYYYYSGRCAWLRRRAIITGSRYWWRRYRNCLRYYY